jgi:large subunit ribosomal protein L10
LAFTKKQKRNILAQYEQWLKDSEAIFFLEYQNMNMKEMDTLRAKVRETGSEIHVMKNTLLSRAFKNTGIDSEFQMAGSTMAGFAFSDPPSLAKVFKEATKKSEVFSVKSGYLGVRKISQNDVNSLAELPALPVLRATLLGLINSPASKLVRTIAEPARGLAAVVKAYSEQG